MEAFAEEYRTLYASLQSQHKKVKEVTISLEMLQLHFPEFDLTDIKNSVSNEMKAGDVLMSRVETMKAKRLELMSVCRDNMSKTFRHFKMLEGLGELADATSVDEFTVDMLKFLFPETPNLQIRSDPPLIPKVQKKETVDEKADVKVELKIFTGVCEGLRGVGNANEFMTLF